MLNKDTVPISGLEIDGVGIPGQGTMTAHSFGQVQNYIPDDNGNVFRLCEQYYVLLRRLVNDWLKKRAELKPPP